MNLIFNEIINNLNEELLHSYKLIISMSETR